MSNSNYIEFRKWLKHFAMLGEEDKSCYPFPIYKRRFDKSSIKSQLSVIYTNYKIIMNKEIDEYGKNNIIDSIISDRYEVLKSLGKSIQETNNNSETFDTVNQYLNNCVIIRDEISMLMHEKDLVERHIRKIK